MEPPPPCTIILAELKFSVGMKLIRALIKGNPTIAQTYVVRSYSHLKMN